MTAKKKLLVVLCSFVAVVAIVVASVMGTVAYLTSSAAVSNVFTIGNVKMHMYETSVDQNGNSIEAVPGKKTAITNSYLLVNGSTYTKDPTIYIDAGSVSSYLFVIARNDIASIEDYDELTMKEQLLIKGWMKYSVAATGNIYVYTGVQEGEFKDEWAAAVEEIVNANDPKTKSTKEEKAAVAAARMAALENLYTTFKGGVKAIGVGSATEQVTVDLFDHFTVYAYADLTIHASSKVTITAVAIQTADFGSEIGTKDALDAAWAAVIATYPTIHLPS